MKEHETWFGVEISVNDESVEFFCKHINYSICEEEEEEERD
jgi:hypothetical protein